MTPEIIVAGIACFGTIASAWLAHRTKQDVNQVSKKVDPVSNGFSRTVLELLVEIKEKQDDQGAQITAGRDSIVLLQRIINQHLADHERARKRTRRTAQTKSPA